jgi:hypothetical protein
VPLLGRGVLAIWNGIAPEAEEEFVAWHVREHIPERVSLPGFLRGRRYVAVDGVPKYFNFYETHTAADLSSPVYLARLDAPTEWTRKVVAKFVDTSRTVCDVVWTLGDGEGGFIEAIVLDTAREPDAFAAQLQQQLRATFETNHGLVGVHLLRGHVDQSRRDTAETRLRSDPDRVAPWVLLVETSSAGALARIRTADVGNERLASAGNVIGRGIYQLQFSLAK